MLIVETGTAQFPVDATTFVVQHSLGVVPQNVIINSEFESENYRIKSTIDVWTSTQVTFARTLGSGSLRSFKYTLIGVAKSKIPR